MERIHEHVVRISRKIQNAYVRKLLIVIVLLAQVALIAFWTGQRSNYYIDELFSFGSAHSYTFDKKDIMYVNRSEEWKYENWINNSELKVKLEVTESESLFSQKPAKAIRMLLTRRNYHGLLNVLMSVFSQGKVSMYPPIVFNIILFILTQLLLYRIMNKLTGSFSVSLLTVLMYGFSAMAISTVLYVRFYMLVTLLLLMLIQIHQIMWQQDKLIRCEAGTLFSLAILYFAMKDSELVFVVGGALVGCYALGLLIGKQWKKALLYILTILPISLTYTVAKTNMFEIALHPEKYVNSDGAESWITERLLSVSMDRTVSLFFEYLRWISDLMFGSWYVLCSFLIIILILLEIKVLGRKRPDIGERGNNRTGFIWVIAAVCLIYYVFSLLVSIPAERYFMFYFPMLTILLWKLLHELTKDVRHRKEVLFGSAFLVFIGVAALHMVRPDKIDFVYMADRPLIQAVQETEISDAIAIYTDERDSNHACYECINLMPDHARLYPVRRKKHHIDASGCPEQVLIWIHVHRDPESYVADLLKEGYVLSQLGSTHASDVYIARKQ